MNSAVGIAPVVDLEKARLHATLRFAVGVTAAFLLCEFMQWAPTFLGPVFTAVLLANLPGKPPLKLGVGLVIVISLAALYAFGLSTLLRGTPTVLFGLISLTMFVAFFGMLTGKPALPAMLLLICLATIPVIVLTVPAYGNILPLALVRGMVIAIVLVWAMYWLWPCSKPPEAAAAAPLSATPLETALLSTAAIVPLMLVFLLLGWADALPVLVTSVLLVATFDLARGRMQALAMVFGQFVGGVLALVLHTALLTMPSLPVLGLLLFLVLLGFGWKIAAGGPAAGVAGVACNGMLIILSTAIASGPGSLSIWMTRLFQFFLAAVFAVIVMTLIRPRAKPDPA